MKSGFIDNLPEWIKAYDPQLVLGIAVALVILFFLIIILIIRKRKSSSMPALNIASFQIAPLGRDAVFKLNNSTAPVTLLALEVLDRPDIQSKNQVAGHVLSTGANYSIFLEVNGNHRINPDFKIAITFVNTQRQTYRQIFSLDPIESVSLRRKRS